MTTSAPLDRAVRALEQGELIVYPTDTLIGLGARADRASAVRRLIRAKGRSPSQPLSFAVSSYEELEPWAALGEGARTEIRRRLPGPFTLLLRASPNARSHLAPAMLGDGGTVGVRIPDHPVARELARRAGPIVSTSANPHGAPSARTLTEARSYFGASVSVYLAARPAPSGRPSEILDLTGSVRSTVRRSRG
ncbi:MAG: threonylcarbamoyl-AMP synthase [Thermoplasmata archaeon]|nr:threonylcarbamoyl-AMP synthase [Thermoplasmata archaeon]MCI4359599.1 threonylcarbamoyl-AMP synthase [Thermoplasmata archaeon]